MNFPDTPTIGTTYSYGGRTWSFNGVAWDMQTQALQPTSIPSLPASKITSGSFADARITESSVRQYESKFSITWSQVQGAPTAMPPTAHNHTIAQVTGLQTALNGKANLNQSATFGDLTAKGFAGDPLNGVLYLGTGYVYNRGQHGDLEFYTTAGGYARLSTAGKILTSADATADLFKSSSGGPGEKYRVGDDASLWDVTLAHTMGIRSVSAPTYGYVTFGADQTQFGWNGEFLCYGPHIVWHSGNFSPGSKLDYRPELDPHCHTVTNWNDAASNGFFMAVDAANAPSGDWLMGRVTTHNSLWIEQEVWSFTSGAAVQPRWRRQKLNGYWSAWVRADASGVIVSAADPGAVGAGVVWIQPV